MQVVENTPGRLVLEDRLWRGYDWITVGGAALLLAAAGALTYYAPWPGAFPTILAMGLLGGAGGWSLYLAAPRRLRLELDRGTGGLIHEEWKLMAYRRETARPGDVRHVSSGRVLETPRLLVKQQTWPLALNPRRSEQARAALAQLRDALRGAGAAV